MKIIDRNVGLKHSTFLPRLFEIELSFVIVYIKSQKSNLNTKYDLINYMKLVLLV